MFLNTDSQSRRDFPVGVFWRWRSICEVDGHWLTLWLTSSCKENGRGESDGWSWGDRFTARYYCKWYSCRLCCTPFCEIFLHWVGTPQENSGELGKGLLNCLTSCWFVGWARAFIALTRLGIRKSIRCVKIEWWGVGVVICLEWAADCLCIVQLMLLPCQNPVISCII